jgi:hypothetical protein
MEVKENDENVSCPLVSCIMPTYNRRRLVPQAIEYFLRQDYANRELIIMDEGGDAVGDIIPDLPDIRYIRIRGRNSIGISASGAETVSGQNVTALAQLRGGKFYFAGMTTIGTTRTAFRARPGR